MDLAVLPKFLQPGCTSPCDDDRHTVSSLEFRTQEWSQYIAGIQRELALRPVGHVVTAQKNVEPFVEMALKCSTCGPRAWADMTKFTQLLANEIDEAVSKVRPEF